jgi:DNA replication and repair protein RecF
MRASLVERLSPSATDAHRDISGVSEDLELRFAPGNEEDFRAHLTRTHAQELRLRQTQVGPHRDDVVLLVNGMPANQYASEGQQRTVALSLKIAQSRVFASEEGAPPLLLLDDIFGELDPTRRNLLLRALPADGQKLVTATNMDWQKAEVGGPVLRLAGGILTRG